MIYQLNKELDEYLKWREFYNKFEIANTIADFYEKKHEDNRYIKDAYRELARQYIIENKMYLEDEERTRKREKWYLDQLEMDELKEYWDKVFKPYRVDHWEWETKASQLVIATCKLVYKYYNDWDRYDRKSVNPMGTYANRIRRHCFKLIGWNNYEEKLRHILTNAILNVDKYKNKPKVWTIYEY